MAKGEIQGEGYQRKPCAECPWRRDVPVGRFDPERFETLAHTSYDATWPLFACHKSGEQQPLTCAGFLLKGAAHNLSVRKAAAAGDYDPATVSSEAPLYDGYREMAVANGVVPGAIALLFVRDN